MLIINIRNHFRAFRRKSLRQIKWIPTKTVGVMTIVLLWAYAIWSNMKYDDISCHNNEPDDDLPSIVNHRFNSVKKHIYFHETTCNGFLDPRQACVVESAARLHPNWQINVVFSAPMEMSSRAKLNPFQEFSNVKFWRVNILKYLNSTPLEYLVTKHHIKNSYYAVRHTSDVLRFTTLYNVSKYVQFFGLSK